MIEVYYKHRKLYAMGQSDVSVLLSKTKKGRLVIPEVINGMRVEGVSQGSFDRIEGFKEIVFPDSVIYVEYGAITNCDVERISFGKNLAYINAGGLGTNEKLNYIEVESGGSHYKSIQGSLYEINGNILKFGCNNNIAEGTLQIGNNAFFNSNIKSIIIPESVNIIGDCAFEQCKNLETIKIPASVFEIGASAFKNSGLKELIFEDGRKMNSKLTIKLWAFRDTNIRIVDFSNLNYVNIGTESFRDTEVVNLTLSGRTKIEALAFNSCKIEEITLKSIKVYDLSEAEETLGNNTVELKKLIEKFNQQKLEVTYILHNDVWIEGRYW